MSNRRDVIYLYDGTFDGFLTCVFEACSRREMPLLIEDENFVQMQLFCNYETIITNLNKSDRIYRSIKAKISPKALSNVYYTFLSDLKNKERVLLEYIILGYKYKTRLNNNLLIDSVNTVVTTSRRVGGEAHSYLGLVRFSELGKGVFYSEIAPKTSVLPIIVHHFVNRFPQFPWIIHDTTHKLCIVYDTNEWYITETENMPSISLSEDEEKYRALWRKFYDTIEIKERHNEKCRSSHMPKRYWANLTELNYINSDN